MKAGDLDGDGDLDVVVGNDGEANLLWLSDGAGVFTRGQTLAARTSPALAVADFTGNGAGDLLLAGAEGDHGLWSVPDEVDVLATFLEGFGISGEADGPGDDADDDGILNFEELAFNLDPSVADNGVVAEDATAVRGRPYLSVVEQDGADWIEARVIRRRGSGRLEYALTEGSDLSNFAEPAGMVAEVIDDDYERALYRYEVPAGNGRHFGWVELRYR